MAITAQDVKALRDATGAGMMDAKRALTSADGDMEAARQVLRERGLAKAAARGDSSGGQGAVAIAGDSRSAALVMLECDTDFAAKNERFVSLTQKVADAVHASGGSAISDCTSDVEDLGLALKESIRIKLAERITAADGSTLDSYVHEQNGRGVNAVVVEGIGVDPDALHQVALHVAFSKPQFLSTDDVPSDEVERERAALLEITKAEGKPEPAWDKIVEGRLLGWYKERVLLEQGLLGNKTAVKDSLGGGSVTRFIQAVVGA